MVCGVVWCAASTPRNLYAGPSKWWVKVKGGLGIAGASSKPKPGQSRPDHKSEDTEDAGVAVNTYE